MKVLLVDDDVDSCITLAEILGAHGHDVRTVHDGESALAAAAEFSPDTVLLDIGLPDLDGYQVARRLRADPAMTAMRLIAVTGYSREVDRQNAERAGFDQHLSKPIKISVLVALLENRR